jgi:ferrous iron transport protein B
MSRAVDTRAVRVALVGNPNTGKSTLFTDLAGVRQHVGNYPGATVEKKTGWMVVGPRRCELIDLPGLYSLAARSRDEMVAVDVLLGRYEEVGPVHAVICIADATNLERSLYLLSQVRELGLPTVLAVNMTDLAEQRGIALDLGRLEQRLGLPVVAMQAHRRIGLEPLKAALERVLDSPPPAAQSPMPDAFEQEATRLEALLDAAGVLGDVSGGLRRFFARRLLLDRDGRLLASPPRRGGRWGRGWRARRGGAAGRRGLGDEAGRVAALREELSAARDRLAAAGCLIPGIEPEARYAWAHRMLDGVVREPAAYTPTRSDRLDQVLTHRLLGPVILAVVMFAVFQAVFVGAEPLMQAIDAGVGRLGDAVESRMADGALRSLLVHGVLGGVGGVLSFLPQILILFLFIGILEDCGYMARAAYLMDRLMSRVGLSGKSFIPMLSSFACAVPGIMATRVIEDERDRLTTILVAPLLTCSARLPVYALLIAAFIPPEKYLGGWVGLQGLTLAGLYLLGIVAAVAAALVLKRSILRGVAPPFVLELPSYKRPSARIVLARVAERGWVFVRCAGTLILAVSVIVWAALYYPRNPEPVRPLVDRQAALKAELAAAADDSPRHAELAEDLARLGAEIEAEYQRRSILGRLGRAIEPAVRPLGWDWRIGCAVLASFPAREVVVATMGVMYQAGEPLDAESPEGLTRLGQRLRAATWEDTGEPVFNVPVALSIMVFFALCAQCAATLAVIRRETNSWRWPAFTFAYMTALAYLGALATYRLGMWIGG